MSTVIEDLPLDLPPALVFTDDAARTARMINAALAQYLVKRGWMDAATAPKPKLARP